MKLMIKSDLLTMKSTLAQLAVIYVIVALVMCVAMQTLVGGIAALVTMTPLMLLFSLAATDEQNGWERFRLTLPLTRRQIIAGRYCSMLLISLITLVFAFALFLLIGVVAGALANGQGQEGLLGTLTLQANPPEILLAAEVAALLFILLIMTLVLPLIARFGMTKATRVVPLLFVLAGAMVIGYLGTDFFDSNQALASVGMWLETGDWWNLGPVCAGLLVVILALYALSALVATKLYEGREF